LLDPLIAAINKFSRDEVVPIATVRARLEAAMEDQERPFDWRKQRNIVRLARYAAGWTCTEGRYTVWTYQGASD